MMTISLHHASLQLTYTMSWAMYCNCMCKYAVHCRLLASNSVRSSLYPSTFIRLLNKP